MRITASLLACLCLACAGSPAPTEADDPPSTTPVVETEPAVAEPEPAPEAGGRCEPGDDWAKCEGQEVELRGQKPRMVMQHPMINQPEGLSPDARNTQQGYVDVGDTQVIVLTSAAFDCAGAMVVVGTLERVDLGGEPGTKGSYAGWSVSDATVTCE